MSMDRMLDVDSSRCSMGDDDDDEERGKGEKRLDGSIRGKLAELILLVFEQSGGII